MWLALHDEYFLLEKGLTHRPRVLELERAAAGLRGQDGDITASIALNRRAQAKKGEWFFFIAFSR
jgi:hypothetical protein